MSIDSWVDETGRHTQELRSILNIQQPEEDSANQDCTLEHQEGGARWGLRNGLQLQ